MLNNSGEWNYTLNNLGAGSHYYRFWAYDTSPKISGNYSYNISKSTPNLVIQSSYGQYLDPTNYNNITGIGCPTQLSCNLWFNTTNISNPNASNWAKGQYNFIYNTSGNINYSAKSYQLTIYVIDKVINQWTPQGYQNMRWVYGIEDVLEVVTNVLYVGNRSSYINWDGTNMIINTNNTGNGIAYFTGAVSATNFITRTTIYNFTRDGSIALRLLKNSTRYYKPDGSLNHSSFYGYYNQSGVEGVDLEKEVALLRQALYEIQYCIKTSGTLLGARVCMGE